MFREKLKEMIASHNDVIIKQYNQLDMLLKQNEDDMLISNVDMKEFEKFGFKR